MPHMLLQLKRLYSIKRTKLPQYLPQEPFCENLTLEVDCFLEGGQISENTARIGEEMHKRTAEIDALQRQHEEGKHVGGSRAQQEFISDARRIVDLAAQNLGDFVQAMAPSVEEYRTHSRAMFAHLRNGLHAHSELGNAPEEDSQQALETIISGLKSAQASTAGFQDSIDSVPALTGKFKRAKKRAATILGKLIAEMSLTMDEAQKTLDSLSETAGPPSDGQ